MSHARPRIRSGVTLLEVVIAMLVVAVGILGLAALLPVGRYELAEANKYDRGSTLGRAAYRDLLVRGILRPEMWLYVGGSAGMMPVVNGASFRAPPVGGQASQPPFCPIVIDPLMIAANRSSLAKVGMFPYRIGASQLESAAPVIPRATIRMYPPPSIAQPMTLGGAERIFRSTDDLVFTVPTDKSQDPMPLFRQAPGLSGSRSNVAARASQGDFSWIVTVAPSIAEAQGYPGLPGNALTVRQYSVCVAVIYKRILDNLNDPLLVNNQNRGEKLVFVDFLGMGSNTSSDARIRITGMKNQQAAEEALAVKANSWIMVTCRTGGNNTILMQPSSTSTGPNTMAPAPRYSYTTVQWYRVLGAADVVEKADSSGESWYRSVRLAGRDFGQWFNDDDTFTYSAAQGDPGYDPPTGFGTILNGCINVYEKTMTTDGTSMWTYQ